LAHEPKSCDQAIAIVLVLKPASGCGIALMLETSQGSTGEEIVVYNNWPYVELGNGTGSTEGHIHK
jgi:hypothetical protein